VITIDPYLLNILIGCLFILVFGGLSYLRREGLSIQFALESVALIALFVGASWLLNVEPNPLLLLILLYLVTLRSRLLVDVANLLVQRGRPEAAFRLYDLSLAWWPDAASRLIVLANRGAAQLRSGHVDAAIETLERVLSTDEQPRLGIKYEAACHYNLGYAYEKKGEMGQAVVEYNRAIDILPGSPYAQAAQAALKRRKKRD
jgi:tetratricopeptide (TPR) repeat protein